MAQRGHRDGYSPSWIVEEYLAAGADYAVGDFIQRVDVALGIASDRVRASRALDQLVLSELGIDPVGSRAPGARFEAQGRVPSAEATGARGRARLRSISLDAIGAATPGKPRVGSSCPTSPNSSASVRSR